MIKIDNKISELSNRELLVYNDMNQILLNLYEKQANIMISQNNNVDLTDFHNAQKVKQAIYKEIKRRVDSLEF